MTIDENYIYTGLIYPSKNIKDSWIAYCIDLDISAQGYSNIHAFKALIDACKIIVKNSGDTDPTDIDISDLSVWDKVFLLTDHGYKISDICHSLSRPLSVEFRIDGSLVAAHEFQDNEACNSKKSWFNL